MTSSANQDWLPLRDLFSSCFSSLNNAVLDSLRALLDESRKLLNCSEAAILIPSETRNELQFLVSVNSRPEVPALLKEILVPCDRSIAGYVFSTGEMMAMANPDDFYQEVDQKTGLQTNIYLAAPIVSREEILGVATFVNRPAGQAQIAFDQVEIELSMRLSDLAAIGLKYYHRMTLQQQLLQRDLQQLDALPEVACDLSSRHHFDGDLAEQSPAVRVLIQLEMMSRREQELAADLMAVVMSHHQSGQSYY